MSINTTLYKAERWPDRVCDTVSEAISGMVKVWRLEDIYPKVERETPDGVKLIAKIMPHQQAYHDGVTYNGKKAKIVIHSGGVGSGKSLAGSVQIIYLLRRYPGIKIVVVTGYDYYFDESMWPNFFKVLPEDDPFWAYKNKKTRIFICNNGSELRFKAYDDADKVKGWEAHIIWIEEASELGDGNSGKAVAIFKALTMRLRAKPESYPRMIYITQNPKGHNWVWKTGVKGNALGDKGKETSIDCCQCFDRLNKHDPDQRERVEECRKTCQKWCSDYPEGLRYYEYELITPSGDVYYTIRSGSEANTNNPKGYIEMMLDQMTDDPETRARMVEGGFNPLNTLVYDWPVYSPRTHVVTLDSVLEYYDWNRSRNQKIPTDLPVFVGIDVGGNTSPWAVLVFVLLPDDVFLCVDEYYKNGVNWDEVIHEIHKMTDKYENCRFFLDPYSGPQKQGADQKSVEAHFKENGIPVEYPDGYNRPGGVMHVKNFLWRDKDQECPFVCIEYSAGLGGVRIPIYHTDEMAASGQWEIGKSALYYLDGACPFHLKEKEVWRVDKKPTREAKEHEEGLTKIVPEKFVDSDDHAQTAEIFALGGYGVMPSRRGSYRKKRDEPDGPRLPYNVTRKRGSYA